MDAHSSLLGQHCRVCGEGPFVKCLDTALRGFAVERQTYYGGTFVGNHVHRTLKISLVIKIHTKQTLLIILAAKHPNTLQCSPYCGKNTLYSYWRDKFEPLFTLFAWCHSLYNASSPVNLEELGMCIAQFKIVYSLTEDAITSFLS